MNKITAILGGYFYVYSNNQYYLLFSITNNQIAATLQME